MWQQYEKSLLIFKQDQIMLSLYQLFMVSNDILIKNKDFLESEENGISFLFQPITAE